MRDGKNDSVDIWFVDSSLSQISAFRSCMNLHFWSVNLVSDLITRNEIYVLEICEGKVYYQLQWNFGWFIIMIITTIIITIINSIIIIRML